VWFCRPCVVSIRTNKAHTYACAQFHGLDIPTLGWLWLLKLCLPAEILRGLLRIMYYLQYEISLYIQGTSSTNWAITNSEAEMRPPLELGTQPETQVKYLITKRYVERWTCLCPVLRYLIFYGALRPKTELVDVNVWRFDYLKAFDKWSSTGQFYMEIDR